MERRPEQIITPVNSTHRFVLQAIEKGTLANLVFDNQAFSNHRAMAALFSAILELPPLKQAMASRQFKSVYLDRLLAAKGTKGKIFIPFHFYYIGFCNLKNPQSSLDEIVFMS